MYLDTKTSNLRAESIADELLVQTGKLFKANDEAQIVRCFSLPHTIETLDGKNFLFSRQCIARAFEQMREYFEQYEIVDVVRTVIHSEFLAPDLIGSIHVAQMLRIDGTPFRAPYPVYSTIRLCGGRWKVGDSCHAILDSKEHSEILAGNGAMVVHTYRLNFHPPSN